MGGIHFVAVTVFVLGRPGSGKSSAARIVTLTRRRGRLATRVNDYDILQAMSSCEQEGEKFRRTDRGGFEVRDFSVLDTVLQKVEKLARTQKSSADIVIIEFARDDYNKALKQFNKDFLRNAYFLLIDTDLETCIQRIHRRVSNPTTSDDHYVAPHILKHYYREQRLPSFDFLQSEYNISKGKVDYFKNNGSRDNFDKHINRFINYIFDCEPRLNIHRGSLLDLARAIGIIRKSLRSTARV
jgi:adenylate kinase family enzyme